MENSTQARSKRYWGRKASRNLLRTFNCPGSTLQVAQDMQSARDDTLLESSAAMAGGMVASGSTCGVVIGGAISLALMHDEALRQDGPATAIHRYAGAP